MARPELRVFALASCGHGGSPAAPPPCSPAPLRQVLNLAHNRLAGKVAVGRLRALKALILNNNQVTLVGGEGGGGVESREGRLHRRSRMFGPPA